MQTRAILRTALFFLASMTALISCAPARSGTPIFRITTKGDGNQMTVHVSDSTAAFDVKSETGIGSASAELIFGTMPEKIVMVLHLRGLEELDFSYGKIVVRVSVSSHGDYAVRESVSTEGAGAEKPIGQESPYWMNVHVLAPSGQSGSTPLPPVTFEVEVPEDFTGGGYRAFSVDWIDFYR